jgi:hypothetical protein
MWKMVTKDLIKAEIDKVNEEYLDALYKIITALAVEESDELTGPTGALGNDKESDWHYFIQQTYGCLADDPIVRGDQGKYEIRAGPG